MKNERREKTADNFLHLKMRFLQQGLEDEQYEFE